ncbi:hypothetical protein SAMN05444722_0310 [Rhodovulum sp. ES.010]|uniref:bifunctional aminoglycoside phosphotransferase/ATP-binding protein n=1 Tax=Rhodovulum sp. ES.010 TaxID=1882821 RepID=UPI000927267B|nr:bifunctional aminoglycoside phosphotransferase/ATP-binding protein [Rhodovulum sp. ES.010]SIO07097.1 hypothetical protein SAMN05444722_0310 [Rhodovulum sp. ES.010]
MTDPCQDGVIAFLSDPATHGVAGPVEVIETHISVVFLAGARAYKLKRAVKLPYTDGSTPRLRLATCEKELALNRPGAPDLYLGVRRITRCAGGLVFDGDGPLVDAVVEMVRFDQAALFDRLAERNALGPELLDDLAGRVAAFHAQAPVVHSGGGARNIAGVLDINRAGFATSDVFARAEIDALDTRFRRRLARLAARLDAREAAGLVRRCHGDLHLRNICLFGGRPTLFDCIEFNDRLATVDVLYDLAFLLMDLWHRGLPGRANRVANRYFDAAATDAGFDLLPFFMALRAAVRAHVTATAAMEAGGGAAAQAAAARRYFALANRLLSGGAARVVALGGLSGSGKTTLAEALAPELGRPPGARLVESDRMRKGLFGIPVDRRLPESAYRPEVSEAVYARLVSRARALAGAGVSVVLAAVYDRPERRAALVTGLAGRDLAAIWLTAPPETLRSRVQGRAPGASDATPEVLEAQLGRAAPPAAWTRVSSEGGLDETLARLRAALEA